MGQTPGAVVGAQGDILMRRLLDLELLLGVNEWWMLGATIPAAQVLSEVASLLAVARAELDQCLTQYCGRAPAEAPAEEAAHLAPDEGDAAERGVEAEQAVQLLRTMGEALPPTMQFARQLQGFAGRVGLNAAAVDVLGIVADRLEEARETVAAAQ